MNKLKIQTKLLREVKHTDAVNGISWFAPVNPDGEEAAAYIDNLLNHIGQITYLAMNGVHDEAIRNEIARRAIAAMKGES
jgi:hypothetical protein